LGKSAEEVAAEAIRTHLEELDAYAIDEEDRAYQRLYPQLREQYPQQCVAIFEGRLIDVDPDFEELFVRIKNSLGIEWFLCVEWVTVQLRNIIFVIENIEDRTV
jgi:hypothetical protein